MCGIAGILGAGADGAAERMIAAMQHRGPDAQGVAVRPFAQVGAARLRIRDLRAGDQPMIGSRSGAVLVFNGEIYNCDALRARLAARGHAFETASDTEVVLRAYEEFGAACVDHLRGMYAFCVVDGRKALLARDPGGIKPLYFARLDDGHALAFASELKGLLRCPGVGASWRADALGDYRAFGYIADEGATLFEGVECLVPGGVMELELADPPLVRATRRVAREASDAAWASVEEAASDLGARLDGAVESHLVSDVPVCVTLSGGLDSAFLTALMARHAPGRVVSYCVTESPGSADATQARAVAQALGVEHREVVFDYAGYVRAIPASVLAAETLEDSVAPYLLFRDMGASFRVCLNGEGSDEQFAGYDEHRRAGEHAARALALPESIPLTPGGEAWRERLRSAGADALDAVTYELLAGPQLVDRHLHPLDKVSMASSVEVRVPYVDSGVGALARALPPAWRLNRELGVSKYALRRAYLAWWRRSAAPDALADAALREKRGFPDARRAARGRFHALCERVLPDAYLREHRWRHHVAHKSQAFWFDLFEAIFMTARGAIDAGFSVLDLLAERAGVAPSFVAAEFDAGARRAPPQAVGATEVTSPRARLVVARGGASLEVYVEQARPGATYYARSGGYGIYYGGSGAAGTMAGSTARDVMDEIARAIAGEVAILEAPGDNSALLARRLERALGGRDGADREG